MAWRIDGAVVRGEIDNRTRGRVTGRIWFTGRDEPVELELAGNCWRDLAGRRLEFTNPQPKPGDLRNCATVQRGAVGDITASRKVKVLECPPDQIHLHSKTGREPPWHWGNSLNLEWFSECNGRVVIESSEFELRIIGEAAWEMSEAEEIEQRKANGRGLSGFMDRLVEAADTPEREAGSDTAAASDGLPQTEAEAEAMQARSDLLNDRIQARLAREGPEADRGRIVREEIERLCREHPAPEPTPEQLARNEAWIEEMNRAAETTDPGADLPPPYEHPLAARATALHARWQDQAEAEGWLPEDAMAEHPVEELLHATMRASVKLTVALNGNPWPPRPDFCAMTIVWLKKVREYLDDALRAAESCREEQLIAATQLGQVVADIIGLAREVDALMAEARKNLGRGRD